MTMRKILVLALALGLVGVMVSGEVLGKRVSAAATSQTIPLGAISKITIVNEGANEVYFRLFYENEPPAAVTTANGLYLAAGASVGFGGPQLYGAISLVCDTAETATVQLYYQ
jgi:hypothetical protein